jgi:hypothetical protein
MNFDVGLARYTTCLASHLLVHTLPYISKLPYITLKVANYETLCRDGHRKPKQYQTMNEVPLPAPQSTHSTYLYNLPYI